MELIEILVIILIIAVSILILVELYRILGSDKNEIKDALVDERLKNLNEELHRNNEIVRTTIQSQFEDSKKLIKEITKELTEVKSTGKQMIGFTEQLQGIEKLLKNPQQRGAIGEYILEQVLGNTLAPDIYKTQYTFKDGDRVDAVIVLEDKILPIDSKFSLDSYNRYINAKDDREVIEYNKQIVDALKVRIKETSKYIKVSEGTFDFAFMFIPSETLYYDVLSNRVGVGDSSENLLEFAFRQHKVIIVSPTTLLAYLQTVSIGLKSLKIEDKAKEILKNVNSFQKHLNRYRGFFEKVGKSLGIVVNHYDKAHTQMRLLNDDARKITGEGDKFESMTIDKPKDEIE